MKQNQTNWRKLLITLLRVAIGWHFLYEGLSKILAENWTSYGYLANTSGFFSGFYHFLASSPALVKMVDIMNMYGLTLIGLALFTGLFIRYAAMGGVLLLTLYYFAYPPVGASVFRAAEGQLYIVDKNFIEAMALLFLIFARDTGYGIDALRALFAANKSKAIIDNPSDNHQEPVNTRREALKKPGNYPCARSNGHRGIQYAAKIWR
jgi:uncharacterized membrane protein YphA (DoxX/SURF4 family)